MHAHVLRLRSRATMGVGAAGGLSDVGVRLEGGDRRFHVAPSQCSLVVADDVGLVKVGIRLQQGRPDRVSAGQRPRAELDP